jgi:hypothetical protein
MLLCQYCDRNFKNSGAKATHEPYCKINPNRVQRSKSPLAHRKKGTPSWNKGLRGDPRCAHSEETKQKFKGNSGRASTVEREIERVRKIKEKAKLNNGGLRLGSGRGKKGWYKGIFCDSSWELAFVIYHMDNNIPLEKCKEIRWYNWEGKLKRYYPDFVVNGKIIEIKGYTTKQWEAKLEANPDIAVLYEKDLKPYIEYAILKYGKDFVRIYGG